MTQCQCHGNHEEFAYQRDDSLMWNLTFDEWEWEKALRSIAGKARGTECDPVIVEALEKAEDRLGSLGHWNSCPELRRKLRRLGINWRCPTRCKPANSYVQLVCQECNVATGPLTILTKRDHCYRFLKTFHDIDAGFPDIDPRDPPPPPATVLPSPEWMETSRTLRTAPPPPPPPPAGPPPRRGFCNYDALRMQQLVDVSDVGSLAGSAWRQCWHQWRHDAWGNNRWQGYSSDSRGSWGNDWWQGYSSDSCGTRGKSWWQGYSSDSRGSSSWHWHGKDSQGDDSSSWLRHGKDSRSDDDDNATPKDGSNTDADLSC